MGGEDGIEEGNIMAEQFSGEIESEEATISGQGSLHCS